MALPCYHFYVALPGCADSLRPWGQCVVEIQTTHTNTIVSWWNLQQIHAWYMWYMVSTCFYTLYSNRIGSIHIWRFPKIGRSHPQSSFLLRDTLGFSDPFLDGIFHNFPLPIGSMYGTYANIGGILMVNVTIYGIHGSYGLFNQPFWGYPPWFGHLSVERAEGPIPGPSSRPRKRSRKRSTWPRSTMIQQGQDLSKQNGRSTDITKLFIWNIHGIWMGYEGDINGISMDITLRPWLSI